MIRQALDRDITGIVKVVQEAHERSISKAVPLDVKTLRKNIQVCVLSAEHLVLIVELDDKIEGAFIGVTHQLWYSRKKQSADLFFYVTEKGTGYGANLMRRFITWSKKNNGVKEIVLGISSGIGDSNRVKQLYERMGATRVGDNFVVS
jgi:RimJ/RimL family protein N-acetyltransferase